MLFALLGQTSNIVYLTSGVAACIGGEYCALKFIAHTVTSCQSPSSIQTLFKERRTFFLEDVVGPKLHSTLFLITGAYAIHPPFAILHRYKSRARFLAKRGKTSKAKPRFSRDCPLTRSDKNSKRNTLNATFSNDQTTFCSMKDSV